MSKRIDDAQRLYDIENGAATFFRNHKDLNPCDANVALLVSEITKKNLPLDKPESWEAAYAVAGPAFAPRLVERVQEIQPEEWPYPWMPEVYTYGDIQSKLPGKMYSDFYNDKKHGVLTERALIFRGIVDAILARENARRAEVNR
jgi:hypothetical protein